MRRAAALAIVAACGGDAAPRDRPRDVIEVVARRPGAAADVIDAKLAQPIGRALAGIPRGVAGVTATSRADQVTIVVDVAPGVDPDTVETDVHRALAQIAGQVAADAEPPRVERVVRDVAIGRFLLIQGGRTPAEAAARWRRLDRDLVTIPGVLGQRVCGAAASEVLITVDPERARAIAGLDLVGIVDRARPEDATTVDGVGAWHLADADLALADVATVALVAVETCTAVTSEGAGIVVTASLGADRRAAAWDRVVAAARASGDVRELPAPATLIGTVDRPGELSGIYAAMVALAARSEVRWTVVEADATAVRLSIGLERRGAPEAIAGLVDSAVPPGTGVHLTGGGLVVREAVIRADDATIPGTATVVAALGGTGAVARAGCIGCALTEVTEPWVDPARLSPVDLDPARVARALDIAARGAVLRGLSIDGELVPARVVLQRDATVPRGMLAGLSALARDGRLVPLADVVPTAVRRAPTVVLREGGERVVVVWARGAPGALPDDVDRALRAAFPDAAIRAGRPAF
jgi:hypothetical protein